MRKSSWLAMVIIASFAFGCSDNGGNTPTDTGLPDTGNPADVVGTDTTNVDTGAVTDSHVTTDATDTGTTPADAGNLGHTCTTDDECGGDLTCGDGQYIQGQCTKECTNNTSQTNERSQCGGTGTTCLEFVWADTTTMTAAQSRCTRSCNAAMTTTGCSSGQICTGNWLNSSTGSPDVAGCSPFCHTDADCASDPTYNHCLVRLGVCATITEVAMGAVDGTPCTPSSDGSLTTQCRSGVCFRMDDATPHPHGMCGSFIDTHVTPNCPDLPDRIAPVTRTGDNQGICIFATCDTDCDCTSPAVCIVNPMSATNTCGFLATGDTHVAVDGGCGTTDGGVHDAAVDTGTVTDTGVAPTDTGVAPTDTGVAPTDTGVAPTDTGPTATDAGAAPDA